MNDMILLYNGNGDISAVDTILGAARACELGMPMQTIARALARDWDTATDCCASIGFEDHIDEPVDGEMVSHCLRKLRVLASQA
jgi:hypothetical protein